MKERFESKFTRRPNGCWEWIASRDKYGYGFFRFIGKTRLAHRVAVSLYRNLDPGDQHVLHRYDNPCCVNPDHLFMGSHADNMADAKAKGKFKNNGKNGWALYWKHKREA